MRSTEVEFNSDSDESDEDLREASKRPAKLMTTACKMLKPYCPTDQKFKKALDYRSYLLRPRSQKFHPRDAKKTAKHLTSVPDLMTENNFDGTDTISVLGLLQILQPA